MTEPRFTIDFRDLSMRDVAQVGGKNASLGELFKALRPLGVGVLDGFSTTADAFRQFLKENKLEAELGTLLADLDPDDLSRLQETGQAVRAAILASPIPENMADVNCLK